MDPLNIDRFPDADRVYQVDEIAEVFFDYTAEDVPLVVDGVLLVEDRVTVIAEIHGDPAGFEILGLTIKGVDAAGRWRDIPLEPPRDRHIVLIRAGDLRAADWTVCLYHYLHDAVMRRCEAHIQECVNDRLTNLDP